jgi:adenylate kinase
VKNRIVLLGPPASGKGTQVELIQKHFKIPATSTGAILRHEARSGTKSSLAVNEIVSHGGLAPDDMVLILVQTWLSEIDGSFLFDGFPRTVAQAERFESLLEVRHTPLSLAIFLDVSEETIRARMRRRLTCSVCGKVISVGRHVLDRSEPCPNCGGPLEVRADDTDLAVSRRLVAYREKSLPVADFYQRRSILSHVHGDREAQEVFDEIALLITG